MFNNVIIALLNFYGVIGEVVNTPDCGSGMHRFDSDMAPQIEKKSKDFNIEIDSYESIFLVCRAWHISSW